MKKGNPINISFILFFAMLAVSTSPVAAKLLNQDSQVDGIIIAFWRMAFAAIILWVFSVFKNQEGFKNNKNLKRSILSGFFLGLHFAFFFVALDLTKMANAAFLGTLTPVFTLILEMFVLKRRFSFWVYIGLGCALLGAFVILMGAPFDPKNSDMLGNMCALICSLILAISFLISEKVRQSENTVVYTRTLYTSATVTLFLISIIFAKDLFPISNQASIFLGYLYLGLVPTIIGHNAFYYSLKYVKPTIIAAVPLGEPIIASLIGYMIIPNQLFTDYWQYTVFGGIISLMGIFLVLKNRN